MKWILLLMVALAVVVMVIIGCHKKPNRTRMLQNQFLNLKLNDKFDFWQWRNGVRDSGKDCKEIEDATIELVNDSSTVYRLSFTCDDRSYHVVTRKDSCITRIYSIGGNL